MNLLGAVLASAVVSAIVSSLLTLLGQRLERKSREEVHRLERESRMKELLLSKAIELALARTEFAKEIAMASKRNALFRDSMLLANSYYKDLQSLLDIGDISEETKKRAEESEKRYKAEVAKGA